jgi:hypothetical protein
MASTSIVKLIEEVTTVPKVIATLCKEYSDFSGTLINEFFINDDGYIAAMDFVTQIKIFPNGEILLVTRDFQIHHPILVICNLDKCMDGIISNTLVNFNNMANVQIDNMTILSNTTIALINTHHSIPDFGTIEIWENLKLNKIINIGSSHKITYLYTFPNGDFLSYAKNGEIKIWHNYECVKIIDVSQINDDGKYNNSSLKYHYKLKCATTLPNGDLVTSANNATNNATNNTKIKIWRNFVCIKTINVEKDHLINCMIALPCGNFLTGTKKGRVKVWHNYKCIKDIESNIHSYHAQIVGMVQLSNGKIASVTNKGKFFIWE